MTITFCSRSDDYHPSYSCVHEVRGLVPQGTPCMACMTTVTRSGQDEVGNSLEMPGCDVVSTSPDRPNILYSLQVHRHRGGHAAFSGVIEAVQC